MADIYAVRHVRKMSGGSQSHLMQATDGNFYIVKFEKNPQHARVLANEWLATRLAEAVGFSVPTCTTIAVTESLIDDSPGLHFQTATGYQKCPHGVQFGSRLIGGILPGKLLDVLPVCELRSVQNFEEFTGILSFDKWTCNLDFR